jgi:hypothetical protein
MIVVYVGLNYNNIMFEGQVETSERLNLLYEVTHYHVIGNLTAAIAKRCVKCAARGFS